MKVFGISFYTKSNELFVTFDSLEEYSKRQNNLLQCIMRASDILLTARNTVVSIFSEEFADFFESTNVFYTPNPGFIGRSGNQQNFDFILPHTKKKIDFREARPSSEFFVLANDVYVPIADKFGSSLKNYDVEVLAWSERSSWVDSL
ncbi:DUF1829 domain-containing protein [Sporosarcina aquimarina]|uniref:DUF1829 domain-containing protein n=1 Tax=Sporosarcina aquimarina TaxID=114975 RepID=UPI00203E62F6|nr:DUF1829 domain-containing protein [Sporosarcina aquimarina]MCM3756515.1 DUF1829 domain-containing protein [Sporosarcina aquimarina]